MDLSNFREEYLKGQLHRKDLAENPFEQFQTWFEQALKADIPEPNAFSLATADAQGRPSLRTVLLKYFDRTGFVFFTNYGSHKARDIEENPQVCMMLPWVMLERQIIITEKPSKSPRGIPEIFPHPPQGIPAWSLGFTPKLCHFRKKTVGNEVDGTEKQILQGRNSPSLLLGRLPNYPGYL